MPVAKTERLSPPPPRNYSKDARRASSKPEKLFKAQIVIPASIRQYFEENSTNNWLDLAQIMKEFSFSNFTQLKDKLNQERFDSDRSMKTVTGLRSEIGILRFENQRLSTASAEIRHELNRNVANLETIERLRHDLKTSKSDSDITNGRQRVSISRLERELARVQEQLKLENRRQKEKPFDLRSQLKEEKPEKLSWKSIGGTSDAVRQLHQEKQAVLEALGSAKVEFSKVQADTQVQLNILRNEMTYMKNVKNSSHCMPQSGMPVQNLAVAPMRVPNFPLQGWAMGNPKSRPFGGGISLTAAQCILPMRPMPSAMTGNIVAYSNNFSTASTQYTGATYKTKSNRTRTEARKPLMGKLPNRATEQPKTQPARTTTPPRDLRSLIRKRHFEIDTTAAPSAAKESKLSSSSKKTTKKKWEDFSSDPITKTSTSDPKIKTTIRASRKSSHKDNQNKPSFPNPLL